MVVDCPKRQASLFHHPASIILTVQHVHVHTHTYYTLAQIHTEIMKQTCANELLANAMSPSPYNTKKSCHLVEPRITFISENRNVGLYNSDANFEKSNTCVRCNNVCRIWRYAIYRKYSMTAGQSHPQSWAALSPSVNDLFRKFHLGQI